MSDVVMDYILQTMNNEGGIAQIQRNELAALLGCVPSQINYVITSRFTPEHGYIVESKRGGGGYIKIQKVTADKPTSLMHIINSIGTRLDKTSADIMINNMLARSILSKEAAHILAAALSDRSLFAAEQTIRDSLRAAIFKNALLQLV
ncbi:MAG: CtsR family transcriptional regulator [Oscillospiraceae bacterium]|jgi:transcriptional regulator CtsR|nr:CtsR family transcriptional regulator [Oscillospiraceae bacterium]